MKSKRTSLLALLVLVVLAIKTGDWMSSPGDGGLKRSLALGRSGRGMKPVDESPAKSEKENRATVAAAPSQAPNPTASGNETAEPSISDKETLKATAPLPVKGGAASSVVGPVAIIHSKKIWSKKPSKGELDRVRAVLRQISDQSDRPLLVIDADGLLVDAMVPVLYAKGKHDITALVADLLRSQPSDVSAKQAATR